MISLFSYLEKGEVNSVSLQPERGVYEARGELKDKTKFVTYVLNNPTALDRIDQVAKAKDAKVENMPAKETNGWVSFFTSIIPFVIIFILSSSY